MARCWKCQTWDSKTNPVAGDVCRRCTDELVPGRTLLLMPGASRQTVEGLRKAAFLVDCEEAGMHVDYIADPYELDSQQPVAGWKTIGSPLPTR